MEEINIECEYCKKIFSTKSNLTNHQKNAKFCLELQGKEKDKNKKHACDICDKQFTSKQTLQGHSIDCKRINSKNQEKIQEQNEKILYQDKKILELENSLREKNAYILKLEEMLAKSNETIAEIAKQPTITNNNNNSKNTFLAVNFDIEDIEIIENILETHLTPSVLKLGQEGVADMLNNKLLKTKDGTPLYECTDVSRKNFEFRNQHGDIEIDPQANRLIRNLKRSNISQIAGKMGKGIWTKEDGTIDSDQQNFYLPRVVEVVTIDRDATKLRNRLANLTARQKRTRKSKK